MSLPFPGLRADVRPRSLSKKSSAFDRLRSPLGFFAARYRSLRKGLEHLVELAFAEPERARPWIREHAQELDDEVCRRHIELYVNDFSVELGDEGKAAIDELLRRGRASGLLPAARDPWR